MLDYFIHVPVDDDFGLHNGYTNTIVLGSQRKIEGIKSLSGNSKQFERSFKTNVLQPSNYEIVTDRKMSHIINK